MIEKSSKNDGVEVRKKIPDMVVFLQPQRVPEIFIEKDFNTSYGFGSNPS